MKTALLSTFPPGTSSPVATHVRRKALEVAALLALASITTRDTFAQKPFNKAEFVARRARLFEKIPDGIAIISAPEDSTTRSSFGSRPISTTSQELKNQARSSS